MSKYQGLINEGSTCYLNSLIQTLFMTYEFREHIYTYIHDPKKIKEKDSIPYQLQKLFVLLQTKQRPCKTKELLKSFQWNEHDSFQQHDVQQFCRILFEAVEKAHKKSTWIKDLFAGQTTSFINCGKHIRRREQMFMDISLPIRNTITNITYSSLEQCIKEYLRPEKIDDKFQCEECQEKVFVEKGLEFLSLPPIFTIQLNRFELNFETMQRQKVNSFLYFPEILQMGKFLKPFNQIQIKPIPPSLIEKTVIKEKEKSHRTMDFTQDVRPIKLKRKNSDDKEVNKEKVNFFDQEGKNQREKITKQLTIQEQKEKYKEILASLKPQKIDIDKKIQKIKQKQSYDLQGDMLFGGSMGPMEWNSGSFQKESLFQKTQVKYQHQEQYFQAGKTYPEHTYALYAVLVHSGGAYGGHYYAYISNGQEWFKFDDSQVKKVPRSQIRKYGNNSHTSSFGANAYLLFYRDINTFKNVKQIQIPNELLQKIKKQEQTIHEKQTTSNIANNKRAIDLNLALLIKVYKNQEEYISIQIYDRYEQTLFQTRQKIKQELKIEEKDENWRIRRYNKADDSLHQIYGEDLYNCTLETIGWRQTVHLKVETKTDDQIFQNYDPKLITVKINVWRPNIIMVSEKKLNPLKIKINQEAQFRELFQKIKAQTSIENLLVVRKNFSIGTPILRLQLKNCQQKKLIDLKFFNGINLYVQEASAEANKVKWKDEFETQKFRCLIVFNNPKKGQARDEQIYFDTRKTLGDLKKQLSQIIQISEDNFRIKKTKQALSEMTTYKKKLSDLRFINKQFIFLQEGKSSKGSVIIKRGQASLIEDKIEFSLFEEIQVELEADLLTVADLLKKIGEIYQLDPQKIRLREYKSYAFRQIFSRSDQIQRIRQKSLIWQKLQSQPQKGIQVYYRVFNLIKFELGPLLELYVDSTASYQEFALLIEDQTGIAPDKILVWKALSNYITQDVLLDCDWNEIKFLPRTVREEPLFINTDGDILIIKEAEQPYKSKSYAKVGNSNGSKDKGKEAQLRITVIEQSQLTEQQIQAAKELEEINRQIKEMEEKNQ